ncbi:hypothetical protein PR202_gb19856 [Eleusine coracana subsp. coracana]|uniref:Ubiquitin-like protease family profile domain-containing protein n=1 Tax=Eleusine coracana subsp. coracana TaxID=191504 RepID=A0AAV5FB35_ELECO|nr:hypothetical protein PR202_gb19856 [Eleusine coracana subsp. coracana]
MTAAAGDLQIHRRKRHREDSPLPHHFHRPQRRRLFPLSFCPAFSFPRLPPEARALVFDMGNFISSLFGGRPRDEGLGLYKSWVSASPEVRDLTVATTEEAGTTAHLVSRRFVDPRKAALEAVPRPREKRRPFYKEALEGTRKYDRRLEELEFKLKFQEEKLAELRKSDQAPKEDLSELFEPLTAEEEHEVQDCLYGSGPSNKVLVLHESSNIEISKEKFRCLRPGGWLNDEVINLYLELLKGREKREPRRFLKCHFFNTFFYKKVRLFAS